MNSLKSSVVRLISVPTIAGRKNLLVRRVRSATMLSPLEYLASLLSEAMRICDGCRCLWVVRCPQLL